MEIEIDGKKLSVPAGLELFVDLKLRPLQERIARLEEQLEFRKKVKKVFGFGSKDSEQQQPETVEGRE